MRLPVVGLQTRLQPGTAAAAATPAKDALLTKQAASVRSLAGIVTDLRNKGESEYDLDVAE